jgi:hypothetical protein
MDTGGAPEVLMLYHACTILQIYKKFQPELTTAFMLLVSDSAKPKVSWSANYLHSPDIEDMYVCSEN